VKELLSQALEFDGETRRSFLDSACGSDASLRSEIDLLLEHEVDGTEDPLEQCAADAASFRFDSGSDSAARIGTRIGPYRIVHEIGHGGMGNVYLATRDDEQYQQQVAIKVLKTGLAGDVMRRRFRTEMQILADLNHPNIARLLDGGETTDHVPYLVMEYVEGTSINEYCAEHRLSTEQRLRLFITVCAAVQYAHQHLVVHRDIKPGNILVTRDGDPKLVDFGIAKLLERGLPESPATVTAMHFMTPEYASPEQVRGVSVMTATDVYSLGVVLYELLSGRPPYRLNNRMPHEIAKAILDQEPERPSAAIRVDSKNGSNGNGANISVTNLPKLRGRLRGDLDNIVLKAMRKEPERRYASVQQLADDIRRHLEGLPVTARPDTFGYRAGKFIRRQKVAVTAAALVALTLIVGIVVTLNENRIARAERARAERRFNEVRQLANSFVFEVHDAIANLPGATPARSVIVQRGLKYLDSLAQDAGGDRGLQRELAAAYEKLGAVQYTPSVAHLGDLSGALESHRKAAALREALVAAEPTNRDYRRELLDSYWYIATLLGSQGDLTGELQTISRQLPAREELASQESSDFTDRYNLAGTYVYIGRELMRMGDISGALDHQRKAMQLREQLITLDPNRARSNRALSISYEYLGATMDQAGDSKAALELQRHGLQLRESLVAADPLNTDLQLMIIESHRYLGDVLLKAGELQEASEHYRKQLAMAEEMLKSDPTNAQFASNHAVALIKVGDVEARAGNTAKAISKYEQAAGIRERLNAAAPLDLLIRRDLAEAWIKLGDALKLTGKGNQALDYYRKSLDTLKSLSSSIPADAEIRAMLQEAELK
jgi:non-specific serine/threonine protein kinase/serine/threonine-protein kinase